MHKKTTYILAIIFIVLVAGYFLQKNKESYEEKKMIEGKDLIVFNPDEANIIDIKMPDKSILLEKKNAAWFIGKYSVIESDVEGLLADLKNATVVAIAAKNLDRKEEFGLGSDKAQEFIVKDNSGVLGKITFGVKDFNSGVVYAIRDNDKKILNVKNFRASNLERQWISLLVDKTEKIEVKKIETTVGGKKTVVEKVGDIWKVHWWKANQDKVDDFLNRVTKITAIQVPSEGETFSNFDTKIAIFAPTPTSTPKILEIGKKDEKGEEYYIKNSEGLLFILDKETRDNLIRKAGELR